MLGEIEAAAVGDAFEFAEIGGGEGVEVFDVDAGLGIVGEFVGGVVAEAEVLGLDAQAQPPLHALVAPEFVPRERLIGRAEELHLHLLKLARAEDVIARGHLVAEALADLRDAEGNLDARRVENVAVVEEDALGGLGAKVGLVGFVADGARVGVEHEVERARLG